MTEQRRRPQRPSLVQRIAAETPLARDRGVDALRAIAVVGVVVGHWLVTAVVDEGRGRLLVESPLQHATVLTPASWVFQTLAIFFLVGGRLATTSYASAAARGVGYRAWLGHRLARLLRPVVPLLAVWALVLAALSAGGAEFATMRTFTSLALSPLWFLIVFGLLMSLTPLARRTSWLAPLAIVAGVDLIRFGPGGPPWLGFVNVVAGWLVPYSIGAAWSHGAFQRRRTILGLVAGGSLAALGLVHFGGYPPSMVGVPGADVSNLNPPSLAAVMFGIVQCGLALLGHERLDRCMHHPLLWAVVATVNLSAMTVFIWHQTAMLSVTAAMLPLGPLPGLHTAPAATDWVLVRLGWLPVFALALAACWAAFDSAERRQSPIRRTEPEVRRLAS